MILGAGSFIAVESWHHGASLVLTRSDIAVFLAHEPRPDHILTPRHEPRRNTSKTQPRTWNPSFGNSAGLFGELSGLFRQ